MDSHRGGGRHMPSKNFQDRLSFFRPFLFTSIDYMYVPPLPPNIKLWLRAW